MKDFRAVVFDMDGLLLDSEAIAMATFREACLEQGIKPDMAIYRKCVGTTYARTKEILMEDFGPDFPYEAISEAWGNKFTYRIENFEIPRKEGVSELLSYLSGACIKRVIVTSTNRSIALKMLTNSALLDSFDFIIGGDQITNGKPHPEIYLTACRQLDEKPADCLALEDSENGVRSARAAGLTVIQVPDLVPPSEEVKAFGHLIVPSLKDVLALLKAQEISFRK